MQISRFSTPSTPQATASSAMTSWRPLCRRVARRCRQKMSQRQSKLWPPSKWHKLPETAASNWTDHWSKCPYTATRKLYWSELKPWPPIRPVSQYQSRPISHARAPCRVNHRWLSQQKPFGLPGPLANQSPYMACRRSNLRRQRPSNGPGA